MPHDLSFYSGERQTASVFSEIRADHRFRYEWADAMVPPGGYGIDAFCGNGYGSYCLAQKRFVLGIDGSKEAIDFSSEHFGHPRVRYSHGYWPFELPQGVFDFAVAMESVEHVSDGASFLKLVAASVKKGGMVVFSTPNEDLLPLAATGNHFHFRHYTFDETLSLAAKCGLQVHSWAGQDTYQIVDGRQGPLLSERDMALKEHQPGQFNIFACLVV